MELMRLGTPGREIPVVRDSGTTYDLRGLTADIDGAFLAAGGIGQVRSALAAGTLPEVEDAGTLRVGAPLSGIGAVVCVGQNYAAHAAETGDSPPAAPIIFFKHPNTVVGPDDDVVLPPGAAKVDWEVELAVVIGARASYLGSHEEALACIAGFTISNDVSERDYQLRHSGGQWSKGKCAPTFNPLGPALIPADEIADPQALRLYSAVNGEPRQDSTTADMVFGVAELIRDLSQYMALDPGDVVNTGTPQGVALSGRFPYLAAGDTMTIGIAGLGEQHQQVVAHGS
ncbi:fumarylacetoacetate hydrolase family protein [Arthrobacter echini]|uniref:Fumarylacetoacetate hydrolase family protein n=1 Tax=Arthrobacter echini TaxID=1529066 RepID=A0A5D0XN32_9MICC|nr:fumarylacetoacetate hydrolase family protein [Arthrobacter echini]TYC97965.1 fumarylacetoacetate hydrolase family protein [Arthrobacter echini]